MSNVIWSDILKIIASAIAVSGRNLDNQVECFTSEIIALGCIIDPGTLLTKGMLRDWYQLNHNELEVAVQDLRVSTNVTELIYRTRHSSFGCQIFATLENILSRGGESVNQTRYLIELVKYIWRPDIDASQKFIKLAA